MIRTLGAIAGDAGSYETFRGLFDPIINEYSGVEVSELGFVSKTLQCEVSSTEPCPLVVSTLLQCSRNLAALLFQPAIGRGERKEFFADTCRRLAPWVNEEVHLRLSASESGDKLEEALRRLSTFESSIRAAIAEEELNFALSERLGFLTNDPARLGSGGFTVSLGMRWPSACNSPDFKNTCRTLKDQTRMLDKSEGLWNISASGKLGGLSDAALVEHVADAVRHLAHKLAFQEYFIAPIGAKIFSRAGCIGAECYHTLNVIINKNEFSDCLNEVHASSCRARLAVSLVLIAVRCQ